jgi:IclR family pca regulon transcriptional regulator
MTLSEVADRTGLTRAAARRILLTLQQLGCRCHRRSLPYAAHSGSGLFISLHDTALGSRRPLHGELVSRVHESSSASVLDGTDIVHILRVPTKKIMTISLSIGSRLPPTVLPWAGFCSEVYLERN